MDSGLFRKTALERISSPERLNEYIKITHPGVWSVLVACLALLLAVGFWAFYGSIPDTIHAFGIVFPEHGVAHVIPPRGAGSPTCGLKWATTWRRGRSWP